MLVKEVHEFYKTIEEAGAAVGVTRQTFYGWIKKDKIPFKYENLYEKVSNGKLKSSLVVMKEDELVEMRKSCIIDPKIIGKNASLSSKRQDTVPYWRTYDKESKKHYNTHRLVWIEKYGQIKENKFIIHSCGNSLCLNIEHLRSGTPKDNVYDKISHKLSEKNDRINHEFYRSIIMNYKTGLYTKQNLVEIYKVPFDTIKGIIEEYSKQKNC